MVNKHQDPSDQKRVTFHKNEREWWLKCTRCTHEYERRSHPTDVWAWMHDVHRHACNLTWYSDHDREFSAW